MSLRELYENYGKRVGAAAISAIPAVPQETHTLGIAGIANSNGRVPRGDFTTTKNYYPCSSATEPLDLEDLYEHFQERVAIVEEGGLSRQEAELLALKELFQSLGYEKFTHDQDGLAVSLARAARLLPPPGGDHPF